MTIVASRYPRSAGPVIPPTTSGDRRRSVILKAVPGRSARSRISIYGGNVNSFNLTATLPLGLIKLRGLSRTGSATADSRSSFITAFLVNEGSGVACFEALPAVNLAASQL